MKRGSVLKIAVVVTLAALAAACGGSQPAPSETASAPPPPKVLTAQERVTWFQSCWDAFNTKSWDSLRSCYTDTAESEQVDSGMPVAKGLDALMASAQDFGKAMPDAKGSPQVILVQGNTIVGLYLLTATHTGPLPGPEGKAIPATNKPVGYLMGHAVELVSTGDKVTKERFYADNLTMMNQLGLSPAPGRPLTTSGAPSPTVVIAQGTEAEAKNVAAFRAQIEGFNAHDAKVVASFNAEDAVFHEMTQPKDVDAKGNDAMMAAFFKGFPDCRITLASAWGAGDYVVSEGTFEGTNTGVAPAMGIKKPTGKAVKVRFLEVTRFQDGKIKEDWLLYDGMAFAMQLGMMGS